MIELYSYQKEGVKFFAKSTREGKPGVIIDKDPGLGKTILALTCAKLLMAKGANVIYVTRKTLDVQVIAEARLLGLSPLKFKGSTHEILAQIMSVPKRTGTLVVVKNGCLRNTKNLKNAQLWKDLGDPYDLIVVDEYQDYKNPDSTQSQSVVALARNIPHRMPMTGTLIGNSELDVFIACLLADPSVFGDSYYRFRSTYFIEYKVGIGKKYKLKSWLKDEFYQKLDAMKFSRRLFECRELPPLVKITAKITPNESEAIILKQLERELVAFIDSGEKITAASLMEQSIRLRQVCSGVYKTENEETFNLESSKLEYLLMKLEEILPSEGRTINDNAPKVIIWTLFRSSCIGIRNVLEQRYNCPVATIIGEQSEKSRDAEINKFKNNPKCKIIVATMASGGVGLNLQEASYMFYFSKSYSQIEDTQSEKRAHRIGSERHSSVFRIDLVMEGTIEEKIEKTLKTKQNIIQAIEDWRQEYGRESTRSIGDRADDSGSVSVTEGED